MYDLIDKSVRCASSTRVADRPGRHHLEEAEQAPAGLPGQLEKVFVEVRDADASPVPAEDPAAPLRPEFPAPLDTAISAEVLKRIAESQVNTPRTSRCTRAWCRSCSAAPPASRTA
ncbi:hypothetical protein GCM10020221_01980 [Streptomyces thioluteus]|uniref:Uncharacterized protein n=1 Tax=Streptomyces thioluteus TaxID=66431 RepID=A0ABP6IU23_STRTU